MKNRLRIFIISIVLLIISDRNILCFPIIKNAQCRKSVNRMMKIKDVKHIRIHQHRNVGLMNENKFVGILNALPKEVLEMKCIDVNSDDSGRYWAINTGYKNILFDSESRTTVYESRKIIYISPYGRFIRLFDPNIEEEQLIGFNNKKPVLFNGKYPYISRFIYKDMYGFGVIDDKEYFLDMQTYRIIKELPSKQRPLIDSFSLDGKKSFAIDQKDNYPILLELPSMKIIRKYNEIGEGRVSNSYRTFISHNGLIAGTYDSKIVSIVNTIKNIIKSYSINQNNIDIILVVDLSKKYISEGINIHTLKT